MGILRLVIFSFGLYVHTVLVFCYSNASDALDKLRFLSVTEPSLLGDAGELEIRIKPDPENGTITITYGEAKLQLNLFLDNSVGLFEMRFLKFAETLVLE